LVLAGFIASSVVSRLVDSMLTNQARVSRLRTLLIKWTMVAVLALLTSAAYVLIAGQLGMSVQNSLTLWLFGAFAILSVGAASTSLIAALGAVGVGVSMFVFVILGIPSAGATVPLEATPAWFEWLAKLEPMHQVFMGTRSLLYLGGTAGSGLSQSLVWIAAGLVVGVLFGVGVTRSYDRRADRRLPTTSTPVETPTVTPAEMPYPDR
jgi:ABC-type multidrug transport system permease subunit